MQTESETETVTPITND